jgi:hypothetical protein
MGVVGQVVPTRHFGERELGEAADAGIATIPGGISLKVTEPHFADRSCAIEDFTFIIVYLKEKVSYFLDNPSRYLSFLIFVIELACPAHQIAPVRH